MAEPLHIVTNDFEVGSVSLVYYIINEFPTDCGNYFNIIIDGKSYHVNNMWHENFEEAIKRFNINTLKFTIVNDSCMINDSQIPKEWYHKSKGML